MKNLRRTLILLAMSGATLSVFGIEPIGCNYAMNSDYEALFQAFGGGIIQEIAGGLTTDTPVDAILITPSSNFAQAMWNNWVDIHVPDDIELR